MLSQRDLFFAILNIVNLRLETYFDLLLRWYADFLLLKNANFLVKMFLSFDLAICYLRESFS